MTVHINGRMVVQALALTSVVQGTITIIILVTVESVNSKSEVSVEILKEQSPIMIVNQKINT